MFVMTFAQKPDVVINPNKPKSNKPEDIYHWRIKQEKLDNVYIPADLAECFIELDEKISAASKTKFKSVDELTVMR